MSDEYVQEFIKEVYPDMTDLAMTCNTEKSCLVDATKLIRNLRAEIEAMKAENEQLKADKAFLAGELSKPKDNSPF